MPQAAINAMFVCRTALSRVGNGFAARPGALEHFGARAIARVRVLAASHWRRHFAAHSFHLYIHNIIGGGRKESYAATTSHRGGGLSDSRRSPAATELGQLSLPADRVGTAIDVRN